MKKSNPEKGLRTVQIDFAGKQRTLKFSHTIIGNFEAEANGILRSIQAIEPGTMIFADRIMEQWVGNAKILSCALLYGLKHEDTPEEKISLPIIDVAIDSFIETGGSKHDLIRAIQTAYYYATNPSVAASLKRSWQISDSQRKALEGMNEEKMTAEEKILAEYWAKQTPGTPSTDSPNSN